MIEKKVKLGLLCTRRNIDSDFFCNVDIAGKNRDDVKQKLDEFGIEYVSIDHLVPNGMIKQGSDARKVADYFIEQKVDAVFAVQCNFGTEDAVAKVCKWVGKPALLWAPRDPAPDPAHEYGRATDSQCGIMATGKVMRQFGAPFSYMTNCWIDDETFERGLKTFMRVAAVVKAMTNLRVGLVSNRPPEFWSVKCNEMQLLERFGVEVEPVTLIELEQRHKKILAERRNELDAIVAEYKENCCVCVDEESLYKTASLKTAMKEWAIEKNLSAIASSCWGPMRDMAGIASCFVFGELTCEGIPTVCEGDVNGAITCILAEAATGWEKTSFFADITQRHPTNDNAELFWHCGVFPRKVATCACKPAIKGNFDEHRPSVGGFRIEDGDVTLLRFDCSEDEYTLLITEGKTVDGPETGGTYGWVEFKDWPAIEHKVVCGPYIHHVAGVHQQVAEVLYEACRYLKIKADLCEPEEAEVLKRLR